MYCVIISLQALQSVSIGVRRTFTVRVDANYLKESFSNASELICSPNQDQLILNNASPRCVYNVKMNIQFLRPFQDGMTTFRRYLNKLIVREKYS